MATSLAKEGVAMAMQRTLRPRLARALQPLLPERPPQRGRPRVRVHLRLLLLLLLLPLLPIAHPLQRRIIRVRAALCSASARSAAGLALLTGVSC